jgi:hypothetical protein
VVDQAIGTSLPILLAILAGVSAYGVPRIVHETAGAAPARRCVSRTVSEPTSRRLDQTFWIGAGDTGTWAQADPCDGGFYTRSRPPHGGRWYPNDLTLDIDCARAAATYTVLWPHRTELWSTWLHVRGGMWLPSAGVRQEPRDRFAGLPTC